MSKATKAKLKVFPDDGSFRVIRMERREHAEQLVMCETLRPEFDQRTGELLGYRVLGAGARKVDSDRKSMRSSASISGPNPKTRRPGEMELNCERSRTEGCSESIRRKMEADGYPAEDRIERVRAKVRVYAQVGAARGDILRVWPR